MQILYALKMQKFLITKKTLEREKIGIKMSLLIASNQQIQRIVFKISKSSRSLSIFNINTKTDNTIDCMMGEGRGVKN